MVARRLQDYFQRATGQEHYVRGTYTRRNLDFTEDVRYLAGLGARSLSLEPVVADPEQPFALREEDHPQDQGRVFPVGTFLEGPGAGWLSDLFLPLSIGSAGRTLRRQASHRLRRRLPVPGGDAGRALYPCHQFVGHPEYCLGDLDQGIIRPDIQEQFRQAHVFTKSVCRSCWARFLCGGGCHAQAALVGGAPALGGRSVSPYPLACKLVQHAWKGHCTTLPLANHPLSVNLEILLAGCSQWIVVE